MPDQLQIEPSVPHTKVNPITGYLLGSLLMAPRTARTINIVNRNMTNPLYWFADSELEFVDHDRVDSLVKVEPLLLAELVIKIQDLNCRVGE